MTATQMLDGLVPIRQESVRFDLYDASDSLLGQMMVDRDATAQMRNDSTRSIRRTVDGLVVLPRPLLDTDPRHYYAEDVVTLSQRVRVRWVLGDGTEYPLGTFLFGDDSVSRRTAGSPRHVTLADLMADVDQPLEHSIGYDPGTNVAVALADQCDAAGITAPWRSIEPTSATITAPIAWAVNRDTRLTVLESLCALAAFLPPYRDNAGILVCRSAPDLESAAPDFTYDAGSMVLLDSLLESNDLLTAPNRYVVIDTSAKDVELVGIFDVPAAAPHSYENTGRRRRRTIDLQGLGNQAGADAAAAAAYASDSSTYSWLSFETPPDPRHDTFDVISFDGTNYRQLGWSLELHHGGRMVHDCRGLYA